MMVCHRMNDKKLIYWMSTFFVRPGCEFINDLDSCTETQFNLIRCHSKLFSPDADFPQNRKSFIIVLTILRVKSVGLVFSNLWNLMSKTLEIRSKIPWNSH